MKDLKEKVVEILDDLKDDELFSIYNEYADSEGYERIYTSDEFNDICSGMTPDEITNKVFYGEFNPNDKYFMFDGYENFKSADYISDLVYTDDIADYVIKYQEYFGIDELEELFEDIQTLIDNDCDCIALTEYDGGEPVKYTKSDKELEEWLDADDKHSWFPVNNEGDE